MTGYAHPEMLVDTAWVEAHKRDPGVRLVEVDVDTSAYEQGHVPGSIGWNWTTQLCDTVAPGRDSQEPVRAAHGRLGDRQRHHRDPLRRQQQLVRRLGAVADEAVRPQGRAADERRPQEVARGGPRADHRRAGRRRARSYAASGPDLSLRAFLAEAMDASAHRSTDFVDVRSPDEFTGKILAPPGLPETCQRGGHIPGAANIPWGQACNEDGTFKSFDELKQLYASKGVSRRPRRSSPTAGSASAPAIPGSCSSTCSATTT